LKSKVTSQPAAEPITLTELKASLRITSTAEDTLLTQYITDARLMVERHTARKLITQKLVGYASAYLTESQDAWWEGYRLGPESVTTGRLCSIDMDHGPVASITSVYSIDTDNTETLYASTNYYLDNYDQDRVPVLRFNSNSSAPSGLRGENAWKITYVAGYGDAEDVPPIYKHAIFLAVGHFYENREQIVVQSGVSIAQLPWGVNALLMVDRGNF